MHDFMFAGEDVVDLFGLLTDALDSPAGANVIVNWTTVVVSELHDDKVTRLQHRHEAVPVFKRQVGAATQTTKGAVRDIDFPRIEIFGYGISPSPLPVRSIAVTVSDG